MSISEKLRDMASVELFKEAVDAESFVGRPFYFDFSKMKLLSNDHWKEKVGGIAAGAFLIAVYDSARRSPGNSFAESAWPDSLALRLRCSRSDG